MFCAEWALVKTEFRTATVIPLKCKCWTCDECRPGRTRRLVEEAKRGAPTLFITLTSRRRASLTPSQAAQALVAAWRQVRREYIREHGKGSLPFLAVFEATKKGWPHIHIVARAKWLDQRWLSRRMAALNNSPVVDVRRVHGLSKVAAYVSKYIGKNPHRFAGVKRYWRSLDFLLPPPEDDGDPWNDVPWWRVEPRFWLFVAQDLAAEGYQVETPWDQAPAYLRAPRE
jgi:hypothetical protein